MSYSARQQYCLNIMGLVAWSSSHRAIAPATPATAANARVKKKVAETLAETGAEKNVETVSADAGPTASNDCAALSQWLVEQPLVPFVYRGNSVSCIGSEQAMLLVVCLYKHEMDNEATPALPLAQDCASLLNQMMRAIEMPAATIRQCLIRSPGNNETAAETASEEASAIPFERRGQGLEVVITPSVKAVLVLDIGEQWEHADRDYALLPGSSLPVWRIPHPRILLNNTSLKRHAWENLKALKQAL